MNSIAHGLSNSEAILLQKTHGPNELPTQKRKSYLALAFKIIREPMILLLLSCLSLYFLMGEIEDSILLGASVVLVVALSLFQEAKSTRALEALRDLSSPRALVVRDNVEIRIAARDLVPSDIIILNEGDRVPADCRLLETTNFQIDESLLTGESLPVDKQKGSNAYSSTLVTSGYAIAEVTGTGSNTEVGKIGKTLFRGEEAQTKLQLEISKLIKIFGLLALFFSAGITIAYGLIRNDWAHGFLAGIAAALSLLPEEFPVIMTIFLALGAWRMSKINVLIRQPSATENLGAVSVLCVDKTGTLTLNQMTVKSFVPAKNTTEKELSYLSLLACRPMSSDPMEKAITHAYQKFDPNFQTSAMTLIKEYQLTPALLAMTNIWKFSDGTQAIVAKGAPEAIASLVSNLSKNEILTHAKELSSQGFRVLGVARAKSVVSLPKKQSEFQFDLAGFVALEDPVRKEALPAIARCKSAGIRVIMMTGDHPGTAQKIADEIGLTSSDVLTGTDIMELSDLELKAKLLKINIFARVIPEQKLRIVSLLKDEGHIVAMTGDGVNDAPSLKSADVGIAMGGRGTDVAREASDIVLLDDNFNSIILGIEQGRRIFHNIRRAMAYVFAVHVPIAGLSIVPILFGMPLALFPAHIVFLELIIDPSCTLVYESEPDDKTSMSKPPRDLTKPLFGLKDILLSSTEGIMVFAAVFGLYWYLLQSHFSAEQARAVTFVAFVFANLGLVLIHRTQIHELGSNIAFRWVIAFTFGALGICLTVPYFRKVFGFASITVAHLIIAFVVAVIGVLLSKFLTLALRRMRIN